MLVDKSLSCQPLIIVRLGRTSRLSDIIKMSRRDYFNAPQQPVAQPSRASQVKLHPTTPPVYRPQPVPKALQPKMPAAPRSQQTNNSVQSNKPDQAKRFSAPQSRPVPPSPPIYKPQPTPKVLQQRASDRQPGANDPKTSRQLPVALAAYQPRLPRRVVPPNTGRPQADGVQPKPASGLPIRKPIPSPVVSRPEQKQIVQGKLRGMTERQRSSPARPTSRLQPMFRSQAIQRMMASSLDEMKAAASESAAEYRRASAFTGIQRPSVISYVTDVTNTTHRASGASGYGGGMWKETELGGQDIESFTSPDQGFALLDERLAAILKKVLGVQWKAFNCGEVKAINNLLQKYPGTELGNIDMASFWVSNGELANPCATCQKWVFKYLHHVDAPG
jgi:hypothetical protein